MNFELQKVFITGSCGRLNIRYIKIKYFKLNIRVDFIITSIEKYIILILNTIDISKTFKIYKNQILIIDSTVQIKN